MKRRKVDKAQFFDDSAGLFFGTFIIIVQKKHYNTVIKLLERFREPNLKKIRTDDSI